MTDVADIRICGQAKLPDRAQHRGGIFRLELKSLRAGAPGDFNFDKFRFALIELELRAPLDDVDSRQIVTRPHEVANKLAMRVRGPLDMRRRDLEVGEHILDYGARIDRK